MTWKFRRLVETMGNILLYVGGFIIFIQAFWISYGVFMRYVMGTPDGMVTEATALMLVPLAFVGLSYACREDAFPKVTIFIDMLSPRVKAHLERLNSLIILAISIFFLLAAAKGFSKSYVSGAASEILLWPRFYFWFVVVISLTSLVLSASIKLYDSIFQHSSTSYKMKPQMDLGE